jgi:hypothetical protein
MAACRLADGGALRFLLKCHIHGCLGANQPSAGFHGAQSFGGAQKKKMSRPRLTLKRPDFLAF